VERTATRTQASKLRLGSGELSKSLQAVWAVLLEELTERAKVAEGVNSGVMAVTPSEAERIVTYLLDRGEIQVAPRLKLDGSGVALATRAGAETPQNFMGIE
jgi:hypothetical protein